MSIISKISVLAVLIFPKNSIFVMRRSKKEDRLEYREYHWANPRRVKQKTISDMKYVFLIFKKLF